MNTKNTAIGHELRDSYVAVAKTIYEKMDGITEQEEFMAALAHVHSSNMGFAVDAIYGRDLKGESKHVAFQLFVNLSSMIPTMFFKAYGLAGNGAPFSSVRSAFLEELHRGLSTIIKLLTSDDVVAAAKEHEDVELHGYTT